jgi:hypothetical protein
MLLYACKLHAGACAQANLAETSSSSGSVRVLILVSIVAR